MMKSFLSCDWGISTFRLRHVQVPGPKFVSFESHDKGIAATFKQWKQTARNEEDRYSFFRNVIDDQIRHLETKQKTSLKGVPLIISGMASSSIGMIEIPYKGAPFKADGSDLHVIKIKSSREFEHDTFIVSGVRTNDDVMRGEETQLAGCKETNDKKRLYIFPGTHSKHILVKKGTAVSFTTFMTGEFFELLCKKSILSSSVAGRKGFSAEDKKAFKAGVIESQRSNILHSAFLARTNQLLNKMGPGKNYYFLSGLLIGSELGECATNKDLSVTLVAAGELQLLYRSALKILGLKKNVQAMDSTLALIRGQSAILKNFNQ